MPGTGPGMTNEVVATPQPRNERPPSARRRNPPPPIHGGGFFIEATMLVKLASAPAQFAKAAEETDA